MPRHEAERFVTSDQQTGDCAGRSGIYRDASTGLGVKGSQVQILSARQGNTGERTFESTSSFSRSPPKPLGVGGWSHDLSMTSDLVGAIPEHSPLDAAASDTGYAVIRTVPVVGGLVADLAQGAIGRRADARRHDFDVLVATELEKVRVRVGELSPEYILDSDEFMAAYAKASRVAAESDSTEKRARLARVLGQMGPWSDVVKSRREYFFDLVLRYDEIHILLLQIFRNPREWLAEHDSGWKPDTWMMAGISTLLTTYVFVDKPDWQSTVGPVVAALAADGMSQIPLTTMMSEDGIVSARNSELGNGFLSFIAEPTGNE